MSLTSDLLFGAEEHALGSDADSSIQGVADEVGERLADLLGESFEVVTEGRGDSEPRATNTSDVPGQFRLSGVPVETE